MLDKHNTLWNYEVERGEEEMYIVVILQIITYVLFILALTLTHNSERKQYDLNKVCKKVIAKFKQENDSLRYENEELKMSERHIKKIISSYETNNTNPYTLARDIKKELVSDYRSLN